MADNTIVLPDNLDVQGNLLVRGTLPTYTRSRLTQEDFAVYPVDLSQLRVWDAFATTLPGTSATDDLGIYTGTWATNVPYVATSDLKAAGSTTRYASFTFCLPPEYVANESVRIRAKAGMLTTVADTAATIDFEAYRSDRDTTIGGSDLVSTSATTINSLTFAEKTFDLTATTLSAGDWIHVRMAVLVNDAATVTAVIGAVAALEMLLDIKG